MRFEFEGISVYKARGRAIVRVASKGIQGKSEFGGVYNEDPIIGCSLVNTSSLITSLIHLHCHFSSERPIKTAFKMTFTFKLDIQNGTE